MAPFQQVNSNDQIFSLLVLAATVKRLLSKCMRHQFNRLLPNSFVLFFNYYDQLFSKYYVAQSFILNFLVFWFFNSVYDYYMPTPIQLKLELTKFEIFVCNTSHDQDLGDLTTSCLLFAYAKSKF